MEGFFDEAPVAGSKRPREEVEEEVEDVEQEQEEMEEAGEDEGVDLDKMLDEAEPVEVMDLSALKRGMAALEKKMSNNPLRR